jgi:hypothetical protein
MRVSGESGIGCIANQTGCESNFITITLNHFSLDTVNGRGEPRHTVGVNCDLEFENSVKFYGCRL